MGNTGGGHCREYAACFPSFLLRLFFSPPNKGYSRHGQLFWFVELALTVGHREVTIGAGK